MIKTRFQRQVPARPNLLVRYISRFDDGEVMRWAFRGLLIGAIGILALDLREMSLESRAPQPDAATAPDILEPILPPAVDGDQPTPPSDPRRHVTADEDMLRRPMSFVLESEGVLAARGTVDPDAAERFAAEIEARGEYIETVSLNSPGGALEDAMAIAELIREKELDTLVEDGAFCASSCPLILAGGMNRVAGEKSAIGVHQFYAAGDEIPGPAQAMSDAQATTARITRHLTEMGVDPALWLHALDTPPRALYYLSPEELREYKLVTGLAAKAETPS
jgi:hypothetical protein